MKNAMDILLGAGERFHLYENLHGFRLVRLSDETEVTWYGDDQCEWFLDIFNGDEFPDDPKDNAKQTDQFGDLAVQNGDLKALPGQAADVGIKMMQAKSVAIGSDVFGEANMTNPTERLLRFGEEAMELLQSGGIDHDKARTLLDYVFTRPKEEQISKEFAGSLLTLLSAAQAHHVDLVECGTEELERIKLKKDQCRVKHDAKPLDVRA
jgi:hypothetical protein